MEIMENFRERVIVALDYGDMRSVRRLLDELEGKAFFYKIGFELFTSCGIKSVELVKGYGCKLFLDLKFHDIPNTVFKAVLSAGKLGADIVNVHASGGIDMMKAAKAGAEDAAAITGKKMDVIAVTVLTSLSDGDVKLVLQCGAEKTAAEGGVIASPDAAGGIMTASGLAVHLAKLAKISGLDGAVCSGLESLKIKEAAGGDFITVTPGIRLKAEKCGAGSSGRPAGRVTPKAAGDQKRVVTPSEAFSSGADYIVVGREITASANPAAALFNVYSDIEDNFIRNRKRD